MNPFSERSLKIGGAVGLTTQDYPGKLAAVVFIRGCPWRCGYCHNPHLQQRLSSENDLDWPNFLSFLTRRVGLLDGVVFSGGEPTVDPSLPKAIEQVKSMGFLVGLHTAGCYPDRLGRLLKSVDWIGFDVKTSKENYDSLTGMSGSGEATFESLAQILASGVDFECRTTISPDWLPEDHLTTLIDRLHELGVRRYALQRFRAVVPDGPIIGPSVPANYPSEALLTRCRSLFDEFSLR